MSFFKIIIILIFGLFTFSLSYADSHGEVVAKAKEVITDLENHVDAEEVPLNDPFAGNEAYSIDNMNLPAAVIISGAIIGEIKIAIIKPLYGMCGLLNPNAANVPKAVAITVAMIPI